MLVHNILERCAGCVTWNVVSRCAASCLTPEPHNPHKLHNHHLSIVLVINFFFNIMAKSSFCDKIVNIIHSKFMTPILVDSNLMVNEYHCRQIAL